MKSLCPLMNEQAIAIIRQSFPTVSLIIQNGLKMIQDTTDYHSAQIRMICNQMYERSMEDLTNRF